MGGYDDHEYIPKKGVPISGKGGWVDPTWDKVLNSTVFFFEGFLKSPWYILPTRARESLGLPSQRDFSRAKPKGNPKGKANPGSPELSLEVYHSL